MKLSTFCVLLASALMLMGALIGWLMKGDHQEYVEEPAAIAAVGMASEDERHLLKVSGRVIRAFGAEYSDTLEQWTMNHQITVQTEAGNEAIEAEGELTVERIALVEGGSRILLAAGDQRISLWPVTSVRVFEGSRLRQGDVIAEAGGSLEILTEIDGRPADPVDFIAIEDGCAG